MRNLILFILLAFATFAVMAQEGEATAKVKISTDKVRIDGKQYYIHIVRQDETLFSISKAYNVSQIEIAMENPDIYLGLQVDQALKIPVKGQDVSPGDEDDNYIYHVVRRRETLTSLTRKYDVKLQEIYAANPGMEEDINVNQVVLIPKQRISTIGQTEKDDSDRFIYHEVKPREGFFSLRRQYGVSEEIIRKFNPELPEDGLKLGTVVRIPKDPSDDRPVPEPTFHETVEKVEDIIDYAKPATAISTVICDTFQYNRWRDVYNVALLLPFTQLVEAQPDDTLNGDTNSSLVAEARTTGLEKISPQTANFLNFYQGALIALDSLKDIGMSINLNVYDTERSAEKTRQLTLEKGMQEAHLIIGPAYTECLQPIADYALEHRIPIVSPLSRNNSLLERNPYLFQANPSFMTQLQEFVNIIDFCGGQNIVLVHEADSSNQAMVENFKEMISQRIGSCSSSSLIHFKEVSYKPGSPAPNVQERISHSLAHDRENLILVPTNNEAFVSDLLSNLQALSTIYKYPISTYGFPSWQRFRNVQVDYYYQLRLHLFTPFFVNYSDPHVKSFITKYRDAFRAEPTQYAYQGFDVMLYFLTAMKNYGMDFQFCLSNHKQTLLQSKYNFNQNNSLTGFENSAVHMIHYTRDYEIVSADDSNKKLQVIAPIRYVSQPELDRKEAVIPQ